MIWPSSAQLALLQTARIARPVREIGASERVDMPLAGRACRGQFVGGEERRHAVAAGPPRGRPAEPAGDRGQLGMGEVRLGDIAGVSGFGVGHRLAGPRLLAVNDGGELVGGAAPLAV